MPLTHRGVSLVEWGKCLHSEGMQTNTDTVEENIHTLRDEYWTRKQLAQQFGVSVRTISNWHSRREGPPRVEVGGLVLYDPDAVRVWLRKRGRALRSGRAA